MQRNPGSFVKPAVVVLRKLPLRWGQRESGVGASVTVEGRVGKDGLIKGLHAVTPGDPDFANATVEALRRWQFTAPLLDGTPIEVSIRVNANFVAEQDQ